MKGQGSIRVALAFAALLASLSLVIWRQSRTLEELRALELVRSQRAVAESERSELRGRIQMLESRSRVIEVAGQHMGMRVPAAGREIVVLLRNLDAVEDSMSWFGAAPNRRTASLGPSERNTAVTAVEVSAQVGGQQ